ncbi:hypothetical protein KUCAC02_006693, partial [Chaenocephalus aceratus]
TIGKGGELTLHQINVLILKLQNKNAAWIIVLAHCSNGYVSEEDIPVPKREYDDLNMRYSQLQEEYVNLRQEFDTLRAENVKLKEELHKSTFSYTT